MMSVGFSVWSRSGQFRRGSLRYGGDGTGSPSGRAGSLHCFQPDLLQTSSALGGQPAALRVPHASCIPPEAARVSPGHHQSKISYHSQPCRRITSPHLVALPRPSVRFSGVPHPARKGFECTRPWHRRASSPAKVEAGRIHICQRRPRIPVFTGVWHKALEPPRRQASAH